MSKSIKGDCPLAHCENRLVDAMASWIDCDRQYCEVHHFRRHLNACIQSLRSVTWILQKQKKNFPKFNEWYTLWQEKMKTNAVLLWLVTARNRVVKEGDLKTFSKARVSIVKSYSDSPCFELEVPPLLSTQAIAQLLMETKPADLVLKDSLLRIERRWIEREAPNCELLEQLAIAFGFLSEFLIDAHVNLLLPKESIDCGWYKAATNTSNPLPPCMIAPEWNRTVWVKAETGEALAPTQITVDRISRKAAEERYGSLNDLKIQSPISGSLADRVAISFLLAKTILQQDGYHKPVAMIEYENRTHQIRGLAFADTAEKLLMMRHLAADMARKKAVSIIIVTEAWFYPSTDVKKRLEVLQVVGVQRDGGIVDRSQFFHRDETGRVIFDQEFADYGPVVYLQPIKEIWQCEWHRLE